MKRQPTIKEYVLELRKIKSTLLKIEDSVESEVYLKRLTEIVVLLREKDSAKKMRSHIMHYYMNRISKAELLEYLGEFIQALKKEAEADGENVDEPTLDGMYSEVKEACVNILGVFGREAGNACRDIGKTLKEGTPNCVSAIQYLKDTPKRAENVLKEKLRNWLNSDKEA